MWNRVISHSLRCLLRYSWLLSWDLVKIMFWDQNISIYINFGGSCRELHGPPYIFCLLFIKTEKVYEHDQYQNLILHLFDFLGWIIFFFWELGPWPHFHKKCIIHPRKLFSFVLFLYEVSIVVLIDFIATLLTPGIILIQIVNTNIYLIYFYSKNNIKMHFPKSLVLKFQNRIRYSLYITTWWNKLCWQEKSLLSKVAEPDFQKPTI